MVRDEIGRVMSATGGGLYSLEGPSCADTIGLVSAISVSMHPIVTHTPTSSSGWTAQQQQEFLAVRKHLKSVVGASRQAGALRKR